MLQRRRWAGILLSMVERKGKGLGNGQGCPADIGVRDSSEFYEHEYLLYNGSNMPQWSQVHRDQILSALGSRLCSLSRTRLSACKLRSVLRV